MNNKRKTLAVLQAEQEQDSEEVAVVAETEEVETAPTPVAIEAPVETAPEQSVAVPSAMISISADELSTLRADAGQWNQNKVAFGVLTAWYGNMTKAGVTPEADASDTTQSTKRVSRGNAKAIAIAEKNK